MIAAGVFLGWRHFHDRKAAAAAKAPPQPVPVTVAEVKTGDFPVYLNGLGTVQPYDTITVRSRVDGEVTNINFKQGQMVQEGDILAQIDPRPYQATLDQATAKKAQDEASLKDAQFNLARYGALANQEFASRQQFNTQQATVQQLMAQIQGRPGVDRQRANPGYLHHDPIAVDGQDRVPDRGSRQYRACGGRDGHRNDRETATDLGRVHRARGGSSGDQHRARGGHRAGDRAQQRWHAHVCRKDIWLWSTTRSIRRVARSA